MADDTGTGSDTNTAAAAGQGNADGQGTEGTGADTHVDGKPATGDTSAKGDAGDGKAAAGDDFEFTAPEGIELDQKSVDAFKSILKDKSLDDKARAQKIVDLAAQREQDRIEAHKALVAGWADEVRNDKEIGGDKLAANLAIAKKAIDLGPPELKGLLDSTGLGNHPAVFKTFLAIGKKLSEDNFVAAGRETPPQKSQADRLYPKTAVNA